MDLTVKHTLTDGDVAQLRDIGLLEDVLGKHLSRLKAKRQTILNARTAPEERQVTDHAIVRYLERVEGVDIEALKDRVRAFVAEATATPTKGVRQHPSGLQVIVNPGGVIVTILPNDSPPGYAIREQKAETDEHRAVASPEDHS